MDAKSNPRIDFREGAATGRSPPVAIPQSKPRSRGPPPPPRAPKNSGPEAAGWRITTIAPIREGVDLVHRPSEARIAEITAEAVRAAPTKSSSCVRIAVQYDELGSWGLVKYLDCAE